MNLMDKLERLVDLMTAHYDNAPAPTKGRGPEMSEPALASASAPAPAARRGRPKKVELEVELVAEPEGDPLMQDAPAPAKSRSPEMSEQDSLNTVRDLAVKYVKRWKMQQDGVTAFREMLSKEFRATKIDDLKHPQRVQLIERLKAEIAKGDVKASLAGAAH